MTDREVRVILDASAITAFTRGSIDVGEVLAEVSDEHAVAGLPVLCLVRAQPGILDNDRFDLLVKHDHTEILDVDGSSWRFLSAMAEIVGRVDAATAVLAAIDHECKVLTGQPGLYAGLSNGGPVIGF